MSERASTDLRKPQGSNPLGRLGPEPVRLLPRAGECQLGVHHTIGLCVIGVEAELLADAQHAVVLRQDHGADAAHLLNAADGNELTKDLGTQSTPLELIADQEGELDLVSAIESVQQPR